MMKKDYMVQQSAKLNRMSARSETVMGTLTRMVEELQSVNEDIDKSAGEIDHYMTDLAATRTDMLARKEQNKTLLANLQAMLTLPLAVRRELDDQEETPYGKD